jgi:hypothetical protein
MRISMILTNEEKYSSRTYAKDVYIDINRRAHRRRIYYSIKMNNTNTMTGSSSDCSTQTTPFDLVVEKDRLDIMLDIVDKIFGTVSSRTDGNSTVTVDSLGASNDENNLGN